MDIVQNNKKKKLTFDSLYICIQESLYEKLVFLLYNFIFKELPYLYSTFASMEKVSSPQVINHYTFLLSFSKVSDNVSENHYKRNICNVITFFFLLIIKLTTKFPARTNYTVIHTTTTTTTTNKRELIILRIIHYCHDHCPQPHISLRI